jgi:hypothetical protein
VEPLLVLLRKGNKWNWSSIYQNAFENLRAKFAESIQLVHPDEKKGYIINTDASGRAIGGVLMQERDDGHYNIVSTASRILNATEQRYSTCERELLAIVYALDRFKIYVYGHKITLCTDNKALTFLNKCVITTNRVARWILNIQEYDIEIKHIKGVQNHLADILSRNPTGLTNEEIRNLTRPDQILVHSAQFYTDKSLRKELADLATLQDTDPRLAAIKSEATAKPAPAQQRYLLRDGVAYCKGGKDRTTWKAMLPTCLEAKIFEFVHNTLGHLGVDKCLEEIRYVFQVRDLGKKLRRFIATCDVCQRVKHPNRAFFIEEKHHFPTRPGDICAVDIYGSLPVSKGNVRYIFVCYDVFSKFIKLFALKSATTKACLNKLVNLYFSNVIKPKVILSDNASQFRSPSWRKQLRQQDVDVRFTPIRHPESNPSERCMRELSKFCRIYCHDNHKKWAELLPHIERWINNTVASGTGYAPAELMYGVKRPNVFDKVLPEVLGVEREEEDIDTKLEAAYAKMKQKAAARERRSKRGNDIWMPKLNEKVLVRTQPMSDAVKGVTSKFMHVFEGPYVITRLLDHSAYELRDESGKLRGEFNKKHLRRYQEADDETQIQK